MSNAMSDTPKRVIPGCFHTIERMKQWAEQGACPICLTAELGILRESQRPHAEEPLWPDLENWFTYHPPEGDDPAKYENIRAAGKEFAYTIVRNTPHGADRMAAIRKVREAVMTANAAIACKGASV